MRGAEGDLSFFTTRGRTTDATFGRGEVSRGCEGTMKVIAAGGGGG